MDWAFVHKIWEKWISSNVGSGQPLKAALLLNFDPNGPSRLISTIAEQEGIKADPTEMCELVSFVKRNKLQTESFFIGQNQYLVTTIHESWFSARCMSTSKPAGEGAILMHTGAFLLIGLDPWSLHIVESIFLELQTGSVLDVFVQAQYKIQGCSPKLVEAFFDYRWKF
ncbi:uncharacterized protein [Nicotiana sylvestris]|uniref:Uncharacterized protein LOC104214008 isoform X1 n=1 Tax=Nicotiana sylvestris TaxID=4096 RepID=A0A1U7VA93_NICSY|nr:PREDICTED: uncharacterized protein LOC104214008 isoform X1 [Nicotiana sylvestris]